MTCTVGRFAVSADDPDTDGDDPQTAGAGRPENKVATPASGLSTVGSGKPNEVVDEHGTPNDRSIDRDTDESDDIARTPSLKRSDFTQ